MLGRRRPHPQLRSLSRRIPLPAVLALAGALALSAPVPAAARGPVAGPASGAFATTFQYVTRFYPRWFTYRQDLHLPANRFFAPNRISPIYHEVVAINDDTLYASSFMNLANEPVVLTVPKTRVTYSLLTVDAYGEIFRTAVAGGEPGTYLLTAPGWSGTVPSGMTQISVPDVFSQWIFRADKFSGGKDMTAQAKLFRRSLRVLPLAEYQAEPSGGATRVLPEALFGTPYKGIADLETTETPILFLEQLQEGIHASTTPPLSASDQRLSARFDALFGEGGSKATATSAQFERAVRAAHAAIIAHYLAHTVGNQWIHFTNIGEWGNRSLDRDAITEYIQYGNGHTTAAYYHAFRDGAGAPLDGRGNRVYALHFSKRELPEAKRFWSLTAYLPRSIELVPNEAHKYRVASYLPGLQTGPDGSVTIYMSRRKPLGVPSANWLPIPAGAFNVMLRVYGPEGSAEAGTYVPPAIARLRP